MVLSLALAACRGADVVDVAATTGMIDSAEVVGAGTEPGPDAGLCQAALDCPDGVNAETRSACTLRVAAEDGRVDWDGGADVWWRGRSSKNVPKHQYAVELHGSADLLGMGGESDWVLNGLWYDRLLLRNKLGFDLFRSFGPTRYAPESAMCELALDGEYLGVYALGERIKRDDDRVDVVEHESFVMVQTDHECFYTNRTTYGCMKLRSPNEDDLAQADADAITAFLTGWEDAIVSTEPYDAETGVFAWADREALIDIVLLEELVKNEDAFWTSLHLWRDAGGKVNFSPWDLDMGYGTLELYPGGDYGNPRIWIEWRPTMILVMVAEPDLRVKMKARWDELRAGPLAIEAIEARLDGYQGVLGDAIARNFERWPIEEINYGTYFYPVTDYAEEDAHVRAWLRERLEWMDDNVVAY